MEVETVTIIEMATWRQYFEGCLKAVFVDTFLSLWAEDVEVVCRSSHAEAVGSSCLRSCPPVGTFTGSAVA